MMFCLMQDDHELFLEIEHAAQIIIEGACRELRQGFEVCNTAPRRSTVSAHIQVQEMEAIGTVCLDVREIK